MVLRRTKIIATVGPATDGKEAMTALLQAGANLLRINMSHGEPEVHFDRIHLARTCAKALNKEVGILVDLQGPKIRIARFKEKSVQLVAGQKFTLDVHHPKTEGNQQVVGLDYPNLPNEVSVGRELLLDDGLILLKIDEINQDKIICTVIAGGKLSNNKGINLKGGGLSAPAITDKDRSDIANIASWDVDYVALSFVKNVEDIRLARSIMHEHNCGAALIAKIERVEAVSNMDEIIDASDGVMVARGDLGVEIGFAELPGTQKNMIRRARALDKAVITATQMMESMITSPVPTRAEVSDVANAVLDGTDAVMLSAESAVGAHPSKVVAMVDEICLAAERQKESNVSRHRMECFFDRTDEAIAMATMYTANHMNVKAIIALTESGSTPLWMSRIRSSIPIFGLSRHTKTRGRMTLYKGVHPVFFDVTTLERTQITDEAVSTMVKRGVIGLGDSVIITKGDQMGVGGGANTLKVIRVSLNHCERAKAL